jgi:hypothetical protein
MHFSGLNEKRTVGIYYFSNDGYFLHYQVLVSIPSASELYRPSCRRMSSNLVLTFADRGCRVVSATDPHGP